MKNLLLRAPRTAAQLGWIGIEHEQQRKPRSATHEPNGFASTGTASIPSPGTPSSSPHETWVRGRTSGSERHERLRNSLWQLCLHARKVLP